MRLYTYNYILIRSIVIIHAWFAIHLNQPAPAIINWNHSSSCGRGPSFIHNSCFPQFQSGASHRDADHVTMHRPAWFKRQDLTSTGPKNVDFDRFGTHFWPLAIWTADPTAYIFLQGHCTSVHGNPKNDRRDARLFNYQPVILKVVQRCKLCRFWTPKPGIQPMSEQATNQKKADSQG